MQRFPGSTRERGSPPYTRTHTWKEWDSFIGSMESDEYESEF